MLLLKLKLMMAAKKISKAAAGGQFLSQALTLFLSISSKRISGTDGDDWVSK